MRVIGVIDLRGGRAVRARGGRRDEYEPVQRVAGIAIAGDPAALAAAYGRFGIAELYVADLDAITSAASPHGVVGSIAAHAPLWLDAGVTSVDAARLALGSGAAQVIVGLETLSSLDVLAGICASLGGDRVAFSLDLRDGAVVARDPGLAGATPQAVAQRAARAGARAIVVLDLARVGADRGIDVELIARIREAAPEPVLLAGGGVRGFDDLAALAAAGCDGALVASAVHDGRLDAGAVAAARQLQRSVSR